MLSGILQDPRGKEHFFVKDPYGNIFQIVTSITWFRNEKKPTGAAYGAIIGVSDIDRSIEFYTGILGYDQVSFDETDLFEEFATLPGGKHRFRRVMLRHSQPRVGAFSPDSGNGPGGTAYIPRPVLG
jgi:hypothetical protein